jgi:hypothetical protein
MGVAIPGCGVGEFRGMRRKESRVVSEGRAAAAGEGLVVEGLVLCGDSAVGRSFGEAGDLEREGRERR